MLFLGDGDEILEVMIKACEYIKTGESSKANDILCELMDVDINHFGLYGEEENNG